MESVKPITTVELYPELSFELFTLLKNLSRDDWNLPTACALWTVKDVVAHLLGGNLGRLSHDALQPPKSVVPPKSYEQLVDLIDSKNNEWVIAARRISLDLLIEFLELTEVRVYRLFKNMDSNQIATVPVVWAGDEQSPAWFDIAREYTEKWLHQQHIREAVGQPLLDSRHFLYPVLDTFMRALPYTYRMEEADDGTTLSFEIFGDAGGTWSLLREAGEWHLFYGAATEAVSVVHLDQDLAWRLFTNGISRVDASDRVRIDGDQALGEQILQMISIMA